MLYDEINYILYTRKPVKILDLNGFIIHLYYYINILLSKNYITNAKIAIYAYYSVISATTLRPSK